MEQEDEGFETAEEDFKSDIEDNLLESDSSSPSFDEAVKRRRRDEGFSGDKAPRRPRLRPLSESRRGTDFSSWDYIISRLNSSNPPSPPPLPTSPPRPLAQPPSQPPPPREEEDSLWDYFFHTRVNDVFLSFRGEDTRGTFISHLYSSLTNAGIEVFKDDETLRKGDQINSVLQEIENSKISIIVFSKNYANSRWCLLELEKIMHCHSAKGQVVLPVFVGVDPSEVRGQSGSFGEAFGDLINRTCEGDDQVLKWKVLLHQVASIAGFTIINSRNESKDIENIVEHVCNMLDKTNLFVADHPVGVESRVQDMITQLLNNKYSSNDVLLVGIWGMGGIGKTTIAKAIYNEIGRDYEGRSFLANIREVWEQDNGPISLQQRLLSDIFKTTKMKIHSIESGISLMKERLRHRRILLILDDVNNLDQLKTLCGGHEWFHPGSRILITTRDQHMLKVHKVDYVYKMKEMDERESFELFSWHAFKQPSPKEDFIELSRHVVAYSGGLPLALQVLGSLLFAREKSEWKGVLEKLKIIPNNQIQKKLKISFDSLDYLDQDIFLDISCFFIGMDRYVATQILNECGFCADIGIATLIERSLVTIDKKNKLGMHDLLRDMGREIIRGKSPNMVEERTRLWFHDDVLDVLSKCTGTNFVEGLSLMLPRTNTISLSTKAFEKMERLRLLQLAHVQLEGDYKYLSKNLKWLCWHGFPWKNTPSKFYQVSLVAIDLKYSNLKKVWKNPQMLQKLKILNLSHSHYLTQTPDFSNFPNLEWLVLRDCSRLSVVHHTIGQLDKLTLLNLKDCKTLPNLPGSIYKLTSLTTLILSGCSNIDKLEEDLEQMKSLTTLVADNTAIRKVPFSIVRSNIGYISLCGYEGSSLDVFPSLIWSWMSPKTNPLSLIQPFESLSSVVSLNIPNSSLNGLSSIINEVPKLKSLCLECGSDSQLSEDVTKILDTLYAANSTQLVALPSTSEISASGMETLAIIDSYNGTHIFPVSHSALRCLLIQMGRNNQISSLEESILANFRSSESDDYGLPGNKLPDWSTFIGEGASVIFQVPPVPGYNLRTMALCLLYLSSEGNITSEHINNVLIINYSKATIQIYKQDSLTSFEEVDCESYVSNLEAGDKVEVMVVCGYGLTLKKTAVYLFYGSSIQETTMEISHPNHQDHFSQDIGGGEDVNRNPYRVKSKSNHKKFFKFFQKCFRK